MDPLSLLDDESGGLRPFSTFGLRPFLFLTPEGSASLQKKYIALSRQFHPDRLINETDEARGLAEAKSAKINGDFQKLKDPWKLLETVLSSQKKTTSKNNIPPDLAAEYFDLQDDPQADAIEEFLKKVEKRLANAEQKIMLLCETFPFCGEGPSNEVPWTTAQLAAIDEELHQARYFRSFVADVKQKFIHKT